MPIGSRGGPPVFIGGLGGPRPVGRFVTDPPQTGDDILANGDLLTGTSSLIDGAATGAAGADGATLTATGSIPTSGVATGDAGAAGGTVADNVSLVDGAASGAASAVGGTLAATSSISTAGAATGDASAGAITLQATSSLIDGAATADADAAAAGATITTTASLIAGAASAPAGECHDAFQQNAFQNNAFQICAEQVIVEVPVPVQAFGGRPKPERPIRLKVDGRARGTILVVTARLIPGTTAADASVAGRTLDRPVSLIPGKGGVSVQTPAGDLVCMATLMAGEATGFDAVKHDNEFFLLAA